MELNFNLFKLSIFCGIQNKIYLQIPDLIYGSGKLKYGIDSYHSPAQLIDEICKDVQCSREHYSWTSHPALEGTTCGNNKVRLHTGIYLQNYPNNKIFQR